MKRGDAKEGANGCPPRRRGLGALALLALLAFAVPALSRDVAGAHDNPLVGRFEGSTIIRYRQEAFDQYRLIMEKVTHHGGLRDNPGVAKTLEGKITRITYALPAGHSTFEVQSAYETALKNKGFDTLFQCSDAGCGGRNFNHAVVPYTNEFGDNYEDQRYLAARLSRPEGDVYVAVYTVRNTTGGGSDHDAIYSQVNVVEVKPQTSKVVVVSAARMAKQIAASGHVALHDIYFDTDKAMLKPSSKPALEEVAKLLKGNPKLKLLVVGHTDDQGGFDYNIALSKRRAEAVVIALVQKYGISRERLKPWGDGYTAPADSNATAAGRAKNRRVELVKP